LYVLVNKSIFFSLPSLATIYKGLMKLMLRTVYATFSVLTVSTGLSMWAQSTGSAVVPVAPQSGSAVSPMVAPKASPTPPASVPTIPQSVPANKSQTASQNAPNTSDTKDAAKQKGKGKDPKTSAPPADDDDESSKPYVIGSLDVLQITVWNDTKLSAVYGVGPDGFISMPLLGQIKADGLTTEKLIAVLKEKLVASVMNDPEVNVQILKINSKKYSILGGCNRNGEFPLTGSTTVMDAFANCGGFKDFSNKKKIYILRGDRKLLFNYEDVRQGKHMEQNRHIRNGDIIYVPE
jgi:polysaccharide biosynthesis/export protein